MPLRLNRKRPTFGAFLVLAAATALGHMTIQSHMAHRQLTDDFHHRRVVVAVVLAATFVVPKYLYDRKPTPSERTSIAGNTNCTESGVTDVTTDARVLFDAVRHGKTHLVRFILEASAVDIVNSRDLHGKTPLMACCYTKEEGARDKTVKLLLRHGADVNHTDDFGRTMLSYVCEKRCNDILRILIKEHNVDPDIADGNGNTPLIYSAMVGNDIACDILIRHFRRLGLNVDSANSDGFTALLMAAKHGHVTCAQILIGQGKASVCNRDTKYGLSVEEWLGKTGFTLQDIAPVRNDGRGRSRFLKFANVAAICSSSKTLLSEPELGDYEDFSYLKDLNLDDDEEEDYKSDITTTTEMADISLPPYAQYGELDMSGRHYRVYPYQQGKIRLRNQETQTGTVEDSDRDTVQMPKINFQMESKETENRKAEIELKNRKTELEMKSKSHAQVAYVPVMKRTNASLRDSFDIRRKDKRFSLPNIDTYSHIRRDSLDPIVDEKESVDALPEILVANVDLGDGVLKSIQLFSDSLGNKMFWKPLDDDDADTHLPPKKHECPTMVESQTSTGDEPLF